MNAVHPHGCGENVIKPYLVYLFPRFTPTGVGKTVDKAIFSTHKSGSPPRVWGKRVIISLFVLLTAVHPHGCGENVCHDRPSCRFRRFTPTGVGKTRPNSWPYAYGNGSPPRVWGKLSGRGGLAWQRRFTPTGVGKTPGIAPEETRIAVHPHGCGENNRVETSIHVTHRFTPTGVGKTYRGYYTSPLSTVHPHGCGENFRRLTDRRDKSGSPPRVWGKLAIFRL